MIIPYTHPIPNTDTQPMHFIDQLSQPLREIYLEPLFLLFLPAAKEDHATAWSAARAAVICYDPQTTAELQLACQLVVFTLQATQAAVGAVASTLSPSDVVRMSKAASIFSREAEKTGQRLREMKSMRGSQPVLDPADPIFQEPQPQANAETPAKPTPPQAKPAVNGRLSPEELQTVRETAACARVNNLTYNQAAVQLARERGTQAA